MPAREGVPVRPRGELRLTFALWFGLLATVIPLLRVVAPGGWLFGAIGLPAVLLGIGFGLRRLRVPAVGVTLIELAVWMGVVTATFLPQGAVLGVIPPGSVIETVPQLVQAASNQILLGVAPLETSLGLNFIIVAALGLLTIALDHVVLTARMPLLASIALVAVWLIPAIAVPSGVDIVAFALLAASVLYLIRAETRTREAPAMAARSGGVTAVALAIGAVAIVGALVAGPALPPPVVTAGSGTAASIDPSLNLGADLRRRNDVTVLTMRSDAPVLPNLRVATLSQFDGAVWVPDRTRSVSIDDEGLEPVVVADDIRVSEYRTNVEIMQLMSAYLPVSYPAVEVTGLDGIWRSAPYSRTVLTGQSNAQGQTYEVVSHVPRPTLEQIRASRAIAEDLRVDVTSLPEQTPAIIGELATQVTAAATTDYDKLIALQNWFRGSEFTYSLDAPVEEGFDDQGVMAVAEFLDAKEGYCIHFAGSFAIMARALDMPSRIVVGFLPGTYTGDTVDGERVAEVTTGQLHAWPEVFFEGMGWVPFEPTKGLGAPTRFVGAAEAAVEAETEADGPTPSAAPTSSATPGAADRPDGGPTDAAGSSVRLVDLRPYLATVAAIVVLLVIPMGAGWLRRAMLRRRGSIGAAWRFVQDTAIDLGVAVPATESPRAFGTRLVAVVGAPAAEVSRLVGAVERASYAREPDAAGAASTAASAAASTAASHAAGAAAIDAAIAIRAALLAGLSPAERARAVLMPRSLLIRPGSVFAAPDASV